MGSDLEITKACALAMGWTHLGAVGVTHRPNDSLTLYCLSGHNDWWQDPEGFNVCEPCSGSVPDPLTNDAHAMALVKKFRIDITSCGIDAWEVWASGSEFLRDADLNRAICKLVASLGNGRLKLPVGNSGGKRTTFVSCEPTAHHLEKT